MITFITSIEKIDFLTPLTLTLIGSVDPIVKKLLFPYFIILPSIRIKYSSRKKITAHPYFIYNALSKPLKYSHTIISLPSYQILL